MIQNNYQNTDPSDEDRDHPIDPTDESHTPASGELQPSGSKLALLSRKKRAGRVSSLSKLSEQSFQNVLRFIRVGASDSVAAGAVGIHPQTWNAWMAKGRESFNLDRNDLYRRFFEDVTEARCNARVVTEIKVRDQQPLAWLRSGPGKNVEGAEPWSDKTIEISDNQTHQHLHINGSGQPISENGLSDEDTQHNLAGAFGVLEQLGYIARTPQGEKLFEKQTKEVSETVIDVASNPPPTAGTNGESHA